MKKLGNYVMGRWIEGDGDLQILADAVTGIPVYRPEHAALILAISFNMPERWEILLCAKMSFHERGRMLKALALHLQKHLEKFYQVSFQTGATRADSWIDLEGGIGNLFSYASLRRKFPDQPFCIDGDPVALGCGSCWTPPGYIRISPPPLAPPPQPLHPGREGQKDRRSATSV